MDDLVLHPLTKRQLEQFADSPTHAVQLIGPSGIGKLTVGKRLAAQVIGLEPKKLESYAYFLQISPEKQTISIDTVRSAQHFLQRKTIGDGTIRRVMLIEDAHTMTLEAQNAFLKSLEEPPADTLIILTVSQPQQLLATITSRLQTLTVHIPPIRDLEARFSTETGFQQAIGLSGSLPGLLTALLEGDQAHPLLLAVTQAKELLQASLFVRLASVDSLAVNRESVPQLLRALERIAQTGLEQTTAKGSGQLTRWQHILRATNEADKALQRNANLKLTLSELMLTC